MLKGISWTEYGTAVAFFLLIYYAAVIAFYYRDELVDVFRKEGVRGTDRVKAEKDDSSSTGAVIRRL